MSHSPMMSLPLVTLYATDRCNSRCITCDYWRHGQHDMSLDAVARLLPSLTQLRTQVVLLSGGEPLLNPQWPAIVELLRENGLKVWLLTSGVSLAKHARRAAELFDAITVSLDGTDRQTYSAIRGLDAFDKVCEGMQAVSRHGRRAGIRVTLQSKNFRQLPAFVDLAKAIRARDISFLAVDVANPHAFGRVASLRDPVALDGDDLAVLERTIDSMELNYAADFRSGYIVESPQKLRRILQYFGALRGACSYPPVRCNAPEFSAVIDAKGRVQPCFFIEGPQSEQPRGHDLAGILNDGAMSELRAQIRSGGKPECRTCVCSLWREPNTIEDPRSILRTQTEIVA